MLASMNVCVCMCLDVRMCVEVYVSLRVCMRVCEWVCCVRESVVRVRVRECACVFVSLIA